MTKEAFWKWFEKQGERLLMLDELTAEERENLLTGFEKNLSAYSEELSFEISNLSESGREIIFSAEGDLDSFEDVINLVEAAPEIDWWEFIAFKPAYGADIKVQYENLILKTKDMYFLPLQNEEEPDLIGLRVAIPKYEPENENQEIGVYLALEAQIGEYDCATLIGYLELAAIPENVKDTGYTPMLEFPGYLEWFKNQNTK